MSELPLGREVAYPEHYSPELLAAIPRQDNRAVLGLKAGAGLPFQGCDTWLLYELSWLDPAGKPKAAMARLEVPCDTPNLVESKSLKLYCNSFNQEQVASPAQLASIMRKDLSAVLGKAVSLTLLPLQASALPVQDVAGECLDKLAIRVAHYHPAPELLQLAEHDKAPDNVRETLYTDLFRSTCPITRQPDWASVSITYVGPRIAREGLLAYLLSFRLHNDFHENCAERIFLDLMKHCRPRELQVSANFTRRGGIDINPLRHTPGMKVALPLPRFVRQ